MITTIISLLLNRKLTAAEERRRCYGSDDITCNVERSVFCSLCILVRGIEGSHLLRHYLTVLCSCHCMDRHCNETLYK